MTIQIQAPTTALYLKDFLSELPHGIVNKRSTGVGGSFLGDFELSYLYENFKIHHHDYYY